MYLLTRENDNKKLQGEVARFIEWSDEGRLSKIHDEPSEGRSLILDPQYFFAREKEKSKIMRLG